MSRFSRREFISGTTAATGALFAGPLMSGSGSDQEAPPDIRIVNIETFPVRYPSVMPFRFLDGPGGTGRAAVLIKMTADDGSVGWGESVPVPRWSYETLEDRKSTRLNSSHVAISYAVFCLKKKKTQQNVLSDPKQTKATIIMSGTRVIQDDI